ncbi:MAG: fumarate lyase [Gammaproteobacteria bacterium]|nr:fumarate lyase [Gammaproteobacteria bacterium]
MISALDSKISSSTFSDPDVADLFSDDAEVRALIKVEQELARVQEALAIIPKGYGEQIVSVLETVKIEPALLESGYAKDGILIPALLTLLRERIDQPAADYLHFGATSQDILDTALIFRTKSAVELIANNLDTLIKALGELACEHKTTLVLGRTRNQNAAPLVFGLKVVNWLAPLQRQRQRLRELLPRLLVVQFGGAVGTNAALGMAGPRVKQALADALGLFVTDSSWHNQRDSIVEFGNWLSLTSGLVGKIAKDVLLMAQSEVGEITFSDMGKSSTMPNKSNPVLAEVLISLANYCRNQAHLLTQCIEASHERDGVSMNVEGLAFPQLVCAAAAAIVNGINCINGMRVNEKIMYENLEADNGMVLAEAAVFELSRTKSKAEASRLVAEACAKTIGKNVHMVDELEKLTNADIDWEALKRPENYLGSAAEIIKTVLRGI